MKRLAVFYLLILGTLNAFGQNNRIEDPTSPTDSAQALMGRYQYTKAIQLLKNTAPDSSTVVQQNYLLGQCYIQTGNLLGAVDALQVAVESDNNHQPARALLGQVYTQRQNYAEAANTYAYLLALDSTNAYYARQMAFVHKETDNIGEAMAYYELALSLSPNDADSRAELANLWLKANEAGNARALALAGLKLDSTNIRLLRTLARSAYQLKRYDQTVHTIEKLFALGDSSTYYRQVMGISKFYQKDYPAAITHLEKVQAAGAESEALFYYLGLSYRNNGQVALGLHFLQKATQAGVSDNLSHYYTQLAATYEEEGNYAEAIKAYKAAYQGSKNELLLYHLARTYEKYYQDKQVAIRYYQKFLAETDTANKNYQDYARYRVSELKEAVFMADSL
jgi:tetratricopeptide (TPR) repeat protein